MFVVESNRKKLIHMTRTLYNDKSIIGRLFKYFSLYFENFYAPTAETLFMLILSMLAIEAAPSVRSLYEHFLRGISVKSLNAFYYVLSYAKINTMQFMNVTARIALKLIPDYLKNQPIYICVDDTMVAKSGKKFENVSLLFDHAAHNGSNYLNGHCFVSLMLRIPVWDKGQIEYLAIPLGYRMWEKNKASKIELAVEMIRQVMTEFSNDKQVILLCDSWYVKKNFVSLVNDFENLDLIGNARVDSVMYELPPAPTGKKGRPKKHGNRISLDEFTLSDEKIGDYYIGYKKVITNIFGTKEVIAYVTSTDKSGNSRRLFFSTIKPHELEIFCAYQKKAPLNQSGSTYMQYIPLFLYSFRWQIETSYYEQKTFWSFCNYMVRSKTGIETFINLINISYCAMKILPYADSKFSDFKNNSVQEFRFHLSSQIRQQVFFASFAKMTENLIKSKMARNLVNRLIQQCSCGC